MFDKLSSVEARYDKLMMLISDAAVQTVRREGRKVGRKDPCPSSSGQKYKKCHAA